MILSALGTYGDVSKREDVVLNSIEILTAVENTIQTALGKTKAINMVHSYLVDTLATAGSLATEQGQDFTITALTTPTRLTNIVEEISKAFIVTRPEEMVQSYSGVNELDRQLTKALKDFGNGLEFDLVRATLASGISGTVATFNGIINGTSLANNTTVQTSGVVFSASILDALMYNCWNTSNGDVATDLFVGGILKRATDNFVQKSNVVVNSPSSVGDIVRTVTTFETSMGTLTIHKHRYVQQSGDATGRALAIRPEKIKVAYLDMPFIKNLAENGAYSKKAVYGSATVEFRNQNSNFFASGYLLAA
jgi:polyhydroxyalkanoate synthesis regulator phasin